jgi:hypothetical protein
MPEKAQGITMFEETVTPAASGDTAVQPVHDVNVQDANTTEKVEGQEPETKADAASDTALPKEKKIDPRQKKIAELSYKTREQERQIAQLLGMVEKVVTQPPRAEGQAPKLDDFQTLDAFLEARDDYREKQRTVKSPPPETDQRYIQAFNEARDDLLTSGAEKYEDFEEVVTSVRGLTPVMAQAIFDIDEMDNQTEIAYYLGSNPKETARISKLSPTRQIAEIGKLEMKMTSKPVPTKRPSSAPAPITPVSGVEAKSNRLTVKDSVAEHIKKRRAGLKFGQ